MIRKYNGKKKNPTYATILAEVPQEFKPVISSYEVQSESPLLLIQTLQNKFDHNFMMYNFDLFNKPIEREKIEGNNLSKHMYNFETTYYDISLRSCKLTCESVSVLSTFSGF